MNIIQELLEAMHGVDPKTVNFGNEGPKNGQTVVGELSEDARRIWGVLVETNNQHNRLYDDLQKEKVGSDRYKELEAQLEAVDIRLDTIKNIFWATVKLEFPELSKKHHLGVCQNGQVYWKSCNCHRTFGSGVIIVDLNNLSGLFKG